MIADPARLRVAVAGLRAGGVHRPVNRAALEAKHTTVFGDAGLSAITKLATEVADVFVRVALKVILVDPLEVAEVILRSKLQVASLESSAGDGELDHLVAGDVEVFIASGVVVRVHFRDFTSRGGREEERNSDPSTANEVPARSLDVDHMLEAFQAHKGTTRTKQLVGAVRPANVVQAGLVIDEGGLSFAGENQRQNRLAVLVGAKTIALVSAVSNEAVIPVIKDFANQRADGASAERGAGGRQGAVEDRLVGTDRGELVTTLIGPSVTSVVLEVAQNVRALLNDLVSHATVFHANFLRLHSRQLESHRATCVSLIDGDGGRSAGAASIAFTAVIESDSVEGDCVVQRGAAFINKEIGALSHAIRPTSLRNNFISVPRCGNPILIGRVIRDAVCFGGKEVVQVSASHKKNPEKGGKILGKECLL